MLPPREWIRSQLDEDEEVIFFEPAALDAAIVGLSCIQAGRPTRCVIYTYRGLVAAFIGEGMDEEEAIEWIEYNVLGGWLGDATPVVIDVPE